MWQMFDRLLSAHPKTLRPSPKTFFRPRLECLEDRTLLSSPGSLARPALAAAQIAQAVQEVGSIIPIEITNVAIRDGGLVAIGNVGGHSFESPLTLQLADEQPADAECPILDLHIGAIQLDLLGLQVETSDICLRISAEAGAGNLLGNLLCDVAHLLDSGVSLGDLLGTGTGALSAEDAVALTNGLERLVNNVFGRLTDVSDGSDSDVSVNQTGRPGRRTNILHLELGPVDLNLLGLDVELDDCDGGPVTVDITAERGPGKLLGNLLSGLAGALDHGQGNRIDRLLGRIAGEIRDLLGLDQIGAVLPLRITDVEIRDGGLVGLGTFGGTAFEVPLTLQLADEQPVDAECPILDLRIDSIQLNLLGLEVETSDICLEITAEEGAGNLLGNLLCDVAHLLDGGAALPDILSGLSPENAVRLTNGLDDLLNGVFAALTDASAVSGASTDILNLSLGPVELNLLGLVVNLDDCAGGPVTVDVRATAGAGNLLGNLLTRLAGLLDEGAGARPINRLLGEIADLLGRLF